MLFRDSRFLTAHSKYTEADQYGTTVIAGEDAQKDVGEAKYNPFADLKAMMNKKK